ncbi:hypothetical protein DY000_02050508 [Brassica cretica]|uniref:Legume lectin domain-containing protein n=1 Tax=Brassica cretica TaxID=69181 RepID=A0ABQ7F5D8_BRACR|nr:hypothetical protein DY000_02050508 [Brassica cretica]
MQIHKLCFLALFLAQAAFAVKFNFKTFDGNGLFFLGDAELGPSSDGVSRSGAWSIHDPPRLHRRPHRPVDNSGASSGGFLGILNKTNNGKPENNLFAVEFDTFQNKEFHDISGNHIGLNINSMTSNVAEKAGYWVQTRVGKRKVWSFKDVNLSSGERFTAWVEFRNKDNRITITISGAGLLKTPSRTTKPVWLSPACFIYGRSSE